MLNPIVRKFQYGQHTVTLETGMMARQATAAVMVSMDDTAVFVTVVGQKKAKPGQDFFPLTVNYQERTYAAGKIPGGFFRREGRPSEGETLIARLIDRPVRPLFPEGFVNEVQVIATVVSVNPQVNPDIVAMIGASAALSLSGIPFNGPIGAARVGYINDQYVLNPTQEELKESKLDLVVAGTEAAVLMVESEAELLSEDQMLGAVVFGHDQQQVVIQNINDLVKEAGKPRWDWQPEAANDALNARVAALAESRLSDAYRITDKQERYAQVDVIKSEVTATLVAEDETLPVAPAATSDAPIDAQAAKKAAIAAAIERARVQRENVQPKNTDGLTIAQRKEIAEIEARRETLQEQTDLNAKGAETTEGSAKPQSSQRENQ